MKKHTFIRIIILLAMSAYCPTALAYDFSALASSGQTLYYNTLSDSTVAVTYPHFSNNNYYSGYTKPTGNLTIPEYVTHGSTNYHVISIGSNAFHSCTGLTAVSIPSSVTTISDGAFHHCSSLTTVSVPDNVINLGVGAFQGCSSLVTAQLGTSLSIIGNVAFEGCSSLRSISIPDNVTIIGNWAFSNCTALDTLSIGTSVSQISYNVFSGCNNVHYLLYNPINAVCSYMTSSGHQSSLPTAALHTLVIGDSVQAIHSYSFNNAQNLDSIYIGTNLTTIDTHAFTGCSNVSYLVYNARNCTDNAFCSPTGTTPSYAFQPFTQLNTLILGDSVLHIPAYAFYGMSSLGSLTLPPSLQTIGHHSFSNCSAITSQLVLPSTLISIGEQAFSGCSHLSSALQFPSSLQTIGTAAFRDCDSIIFLNTGYSPAAIPAQAFYGCDRLFQITLGNTTTAIGDSAFSNCIRLTTAVLGDSLQTIGAKAFSNCIRLVNPQLPEVISTIGQEAFYGCTLVGGQLTFPPTVTSIGNNAYSNISPITLITMRGYTPPTIYANTFGSATSATQVNVPCGSLLSYYLSNYWDDFTNLTETTPYQLTVNVNNSAMGSASVTQQPTCTNTEAIIQATANTDYHFLHWNDGNTSNPRTLTVTSDTAFTAIFVSDNSYITVTCNDSTRGTVSGSGLYSYNTTVVISATPFSDYHFQCWSDGNTQNPRYLNATQDSVFTAIFLSNYSTITLLNNNPDMGTVSGGGNYYYQSQAILTATPFAGHHFTLWNDGVTANPRTVVVSQDSTFTANFAVNIYTLTANSSNNTMGYVTGGGNYSYLTSVELGATAYYGYHFVQWNDGVTTNPRTIQIVSDTALTATFVPNTYTVEVTSSDTTMGNAYGSGTYNYGNTANLSASALSGYHFVQWSDGNTDNPRSLTVIGNISLTAQFAINTYTLTVLSNNATMGTATGSGTYTHNSTVNISAEANYGYHFVQWNDGDTTNPRLITMTHNATYTAIFTADTFTITVISSNGAYGSVSGSGTYNYNTPALISATPFYGYHFVQWNDGNTDNPRTVTVTENTGYTAYFASNIYSVTALSSSPASGTVTGGGNYNYQELATLTAFPADHNHFSHWNDGNTDNPRTFTVTSDTLFTAHFYIDSFLLSATANIDRRGIVTGSGTKAYGASAVLTAIPNHGFYFSSWNDSVTQNPRTILVTSDTAFTATFLPNIYALNVDCNDSLMGSVTGSGLYYFESEATLTATPANHHYFVSWSDGNTQNPRILTVTRDSNITAQFHPEPRYTITVNSNDNTRGTVSGSGTYYGGQEITIQATPSSYNTFKYWSDGNTDNPRTVRVLANATYTALFGSQMFTVTVTPNNPDMGAAYGSGEYAYGEEVTLVARPFPGYAFRNWSDGNSNPERTIVVRYDISYQAFFYNAVGIDDTPADSITVVTKGHDIIVEGAMGKTVCLYDIMGRRLAISNNASATHHLQAPAAGIYMLHIEGTKARKLVIR